MKTETGESLALRPVERGLCCIASFFDTDIDPSNFDPDDIEDFDVNWMACDVVTTETCSADGTTLHDEGIADIDEFN